MSVLQFLREKAGVLVAGVIGLSLFLFVISDFFGNGRGQRIQARKYYEIGKIGNETVSYQIMNNRFRVFLRSINYQGIQVLMRLLQSRSGSRHGSS
jgi:hypothetical protein